MAGRSFQSRPAPQASAGAQRGERRPTGRPSSQQSLPAAGQPRLGDRPLWQRQLRWRRRQLQRRLGWLWGQEGSPGQRARGLAAGVFTGCLPFFGLQIVLGVALAAAMRGNRILAAAGTWISNPLTTLPMCWLNYQIGVLLLGPGPAWPAIDDLDGQTLKLLGWSFTSRLLLGSVLLGALAALISGVVCWRWLHSRDRSDAVRMN